MGASSSSRRWPGHRCGGSSQSDQGHECEQARTQQIDIPDPQHRHQDAGQRRPYCTCQIIDREQDAQSPAPPGLVTGTADYCRLQILVAGVGDGRQGKPDERRQRQTRSEHAKAYRARRQAARRNSPTVAGAIRHSTDDGSGWRLVAGQGGTDRRSGGGRGDEGVDKGAAVMGERGRDDASLVFLHSRDHWASDIGSDTNCFCDPVKGLGGRCTHPPLACFGRPAGGKGQLSELLSEHQFTTVDVWYGCSIMGVWTR